MHIGLGGTLVDNCSNKFFCTIPMYALRVFLGVDLSVQNLISVRSTKISCIKSISTMAMLHRLQRK